MLHNLHHLLSDELLVGSLSVASSLDLLLGLLSEGDAEKSHHVAIKGLGLNESLDQTVPFFEHSTSVVSSDIHAMEVGVAIVSGNLLNLELELPPSVRLGRVVAVAHGDRENSASETVSGVLETSSLVDWSVRDMSLLKAWSKDLVPLLLDERMHAEKIRLKGPTYVFFCLFFFLKFLGFLPAVIYLKC